jgi:hypothetical protein
VNHSTSQTATYFFNSLLGGFSGFHRPLFAADAALKLEELYLEEFSIRRTAERMEEASATQCKEQFTAPGIADRRLKATG